MSRKVIINRIANFALLIATVYAVVVIGYRWFSRDPRTGSVVPPFLTTALNGEKIPLPLHDDQPSVMVFWATWCGPCRVELARLRSAVANGEIPADRVLAISVGEELETVKSFTESHHYPFRVLADTEGRSNELLSIRVTPTILHISADGHITWVGEGVHPLAIRWAADHLRH